MYKDTNPLWDNVKLYAKLNIPHLLLRQEIIKKIIAQAPLNKSQIFYPTALEVEIINWILKIVND